MLVHSMRLDGKSMAKDMKIKSVAFNLADPFEKNLYKHTQQFSVFSAYMKRLVQRDYEGGKVLPQQQESILETKFLNEVEGFI
jgi:hypothetical protein